MAALLRMLPTLTSLEACNFRSTMSFSSCDSAKIAPADFCSDSDMPGFFASFCSRSRVRAFNSSTLPARPSDSFFISPPSSVSFAFVSPVIVPCFFTSAVACSAVSCALPTPFSMSANACFSAVFSSLSSVWLNSTVFPFLEMKKPPEGGLVLGFGRRLRARHDGVQQLLDAFADRLIPRQLIPSPSQRLLHLHYEVLCCSVREVQLIPQPLLDFADRFELRHGLHHVDARRGIRPERDGR